MSQGINKVILIGHLGQDPQSRSFPDGGSVTNCSLATSKSWRDRKTGEPKKSTEWHNLVFRNKLSEIVCQYLKKGSKIYIEGELQTQKYKSRQTGEEKHITKINCFNLQMLDSRNNESNEAPQQAPQQQGYQNQPNPTYQESPQQQASDFDYFDDDIPF
jgi:single-strand DNA-binding protein